MSEPIKLPHGIHAGKLLEEVPSSYLAWIAERWDDEKICEAADKVWANREKHGAHWEDEDV